MQTDKKSELDIKSIYERLDSIEKLLKVSIANDILSDLYSIIPEKDKQKKILNETVSNRLIEEGMVEDIHYEFSGKLALHFNCKKNLTVQEIEDIRRQIIEELDQVIPVFCFEKLNGMKRKRMLEKKISFCIANKEIHIIVK